jgi:hypothetical protein
MSEIKWAYDENTGSFSALPASPFLLVALGAVALLPLAEKAYNKAKYGPSPLPSNFDWQLYHQYKERYKILKTKKQSGEQLDFTEIAEWQKLSRPPWAESGEIWAYD